MREGFLPKHGGFRKLCSFKSAQLAYDGTVIFCARFIDKRSRTHDQMVQAARSGVQNIAEGSLTSATSKEIEIKLTKVTRASLGELLLDYEDFLRQRGLCQWAKDALEALEVRKLYQSDSRTCLTKVTPQAAPSVANQWCNVSLSPVSALARHFGGAPIIPAVMG